MNIALRKPRMSRDEFFAWAEAQDARYEFDGFGPVAMTGGTVRHNQIIKNILRAVDVRLRAGCRSLGPETGIRTVDDAIRYPDVVVTCTKMDDSAREAPNPIVVFEVLSPSSHHTDRIVKQLEYRAVPSIRRYVVVEYDSAALTLYSRPEAGAAWTSTPLTADAVLVLLEVGIEIPVLEFFTNTDLATSTTEEAG
jgi:Uma2 family endonuclease